MKKTLAMLACGGMLLAGGAFAGTVAGNDGSSEIVDRIPGGSFDPAQAEVVATRDATPAAGISGSGKVKILRQSGDPRTVASGGIDGLITVRCPSKYSALSGGYETDGPGLSLINLSPAFKASGALDKRGMSLAVFNLSGIDVDWRPWVTCAKGVKDQG